MATIDVEGLRDKVPAEAIESSAGVGHHLALAALQPAGLSIDSIQENRPRPNPRRDPCPRTP